MPWLWHSRFCVLRASGVFSGCHRLQNHTYREGFVRPPLIIRLGNKYVNLSTAVILLLGSIFCVPYNYQ